MKLYDWDGLCIQVMVFCTRTDVVFAQDGGRDRKVRGGVVGGGDRGNVKSSTSQLGVVVCCLRQVLICAFRLKRKKETPSNTHNNELHGQILGRRERRT